MATDQANQKKIQLHHDEEKKKRLELEAASESLKTSLKEMATARAQKNVAQEEVAS